MYVRAKRLRERGRRRSSHEISSDPGVVGELRLAGVGSTYVANINDPASSVAAPMLPLLYDARLVTLQGESMLFKGEERPEGDAGPAYVQEWSVRLEPSGK